MLRNGGDVCQFQTQSMCYEPFSLCCPPASRWYLLLFQHQSFPSCPAVALSVFPHHPTSTPTYTTAPNSLISWPVYTHPPFCFPTIYCPSLVVAVHPVFWFLVPAWYGLFLARLFLLVLVTSFDCLAPVAEPSFKQLLSATCSTDPLQCKWIL